MAPAVHRAFLICCFICSLKFRFLSIKTPRSFSCKTFFSLAKIFELFTLNFFQIDEKEVDNIKIGLVQEEEQKYVAGSRMSISSRRSSVSSVANRLKSGGRMGRAKDQAKETASQQHAAK